MVVGRLMDGWVISVILFSWKNEININFIDFLVTLWCFLWHWQYFPAVLEKRHVSILYFSNVWIGMLTPSLLLLLLISLSSSNYYYCFYCNKITSTWVPIPWVKPQHVAKLYLVVILLCLFPLEGKNDMPFSWFFGLLPTLEKPGYAPEIIIFISQRWF